MNWELLIKICVLVSAVVITVFSTYFKKPNVALIVTLVNLGLSIMLLFFQKKDYTEKVPAITASLLYPLDVRLILVNVDKELPLKDVTAKLFGASEINFGTIYPQEVAQIAEINIPRRDTTIIIIARYNGTKSIEVDFNFKINPDSTVSVDSKYFDEKAIEFIPDWKKNLPKTNDTTGNHFNPTLFK